MKTVKMVANKAFSIEMTHKETGKYQVSYSLGKFHHNLDEVSEYEIASALFDHKYEQLISITDANSFLFS